MNFGPGSVPKHIFINFNDLTNTPFLNSRLHLANYRSVGLYIDPAFDPTVVSCDLNEELTKYEIWGVPRLNDEILKVINRLPESEKKSVANNFPIYAHEINMAIVKNSWSNWLFYTLDKICAFVCCIIY